MNINTKLDFNDDIISTNKIANNLTTNSSGYVLDARQGKVLNDNKQDTLILTRTTLSSASHGLSCSYVKYGSVVSIYLEGTKDKAFSAGVPYIITSTYNSSLYPIRNWTAGLEFNNRTVCAIYFSGSSLYFIPGGAYNSKSSYSATVMMFV